MVSLFFRVRARTDSLEDVMRTFSALLVVALLIGAAPARAQEHRAVEGNIGGGFTFVLSDIKDHLGNGGNFVVGVTYNPSQQFGIQAEYSFTALGEKRISIPVLPSPTASSGTPTDFFGNSNMQYVDFNVVFRPKTEGKVTGYVVAGPGVYYRPVQVTTPGVGYVPGYCDPYWYVCYPGGVVPVDYIIGERSTTDFGINFGGGVNFAIGEHAKVYAEARYHYMWGPEVKFAGQSYGKANGQFLPLTFGIRF
jgi:opacity protein-like surface antigen